MRPKTYNIRSPIRSQLKKPLATRSEQRKAVTKDLKPLQFSI